MSQDDLEDDRPGRADPPHGPRPPRGSHPSHGPRPPRPVTPAYLERAAMAYLERFASSSENLRRVLRRKVERRCRLRGEDPNAFGEAIDAVVARAQRSGLVDDARYAEARVATLRRRGGSQRAIRAKLAQKGIDRETAAAALAEDPTDEREAARAFARRRRLGPFRSGARTSERSREDFTRDLAALARAGFSYDVARAVLEGAAEEE